MFRSASSIICVHVLILFRRKKDHGRAEAMLITAWAMGMSRMVPPDTAPASMSGRPKKRANGKPAAGEGAAEENAVAAWQEKSRGLLNTAELRAVFLARAGIVDHSSRSGSPGGTTADTVDVVMAASVENIHSSVIGAVHSQHNGNDRVQVVDRAESAVQHADKDWGESAEEEEEEEEGAQAESDRAVDDVEVKRLKFLQRQLEREEMERMVVERAAWPLCMGTLRRAVPTDGYGNPLPMDDKPVIPVSE